MARRANPTSSVSNAGKARFCLTLEVKCSNSLWHRLKALVSINVAYICRDSQYLKGLTETFTQYY